MGNEIVEPNFIIIDEDDDIEESEAETESKSVPKSVPKTESESESEPEPEPEPEATAGSAVTRGRQRNEQRCIHVMKRGKHVGEHCPFASISGYYTCYAHCKKLEKDEYNRNVKGWTDANFERMAEYNRTYAKRGMRNFRSKN